MKVGYFGDVTSMPIINVYSVIEECVEKGVNILISCGNLSDNYLKSLSIISELGRLAKANNIIYRFILGNKDLYYASNDAVIDKERKVRSILAVYAENDYWLTAHPIIRNDVRIISGESHYDYSFYRGKPTKLSSITKKRKWWYTNRDVWYLTDEADYTLGLYNTFDYRLTKELNDSLDARLTNANRMYGRAIRTVVCTNIVPHKGLLSNKGLFANYKGTFKGNVRFHNILKSHGIVECHFGCTSPEVYTKIDGISYYSSSVSSIDSLIDVVDYSS